MSKVCSFTGHRPNKLSGYNPKDNAKLLWKLHEVIVDHVKDKDVDTFINGVALGIDMWGARIVIKLKETYPHLKLISAIPCRNHSNRWPESSQKEWQFVIDNSDETVLVTDEEYKPFHMQIRNQYMVDNSDYVISVHDGSKGGTGNCVEYARKKNKQITNIDPKLYQ